MPECFKDDNASQWWSGKFDPRSLRNPWTDQYDVYICMDDYVGDPYPCAKFHYDTITPFRPPPNMRKCASTDSASFFGFFFCLQPRPLLYTPICTINTSNDVVSHKDVPFGGPENKILHFDPIFPQKRKFVANFRRDRKFRIKKAWTMGMLTCKLSLIVIVAQWKLYSE